MPRHLALLFSFTLISVSTWAADPWPGFRGPHGNGVFQSSRAPLNWTAEEHVTWRTEIPGSGWSSPVIGRGRIYLTAAIGEGKELDLCLLVLDEKTGELIARHVVMKQTSDKSPRIHAKNSHASPTPLLDGDRIYCHFGYQGTACLDLEGNVLWSNRDLYFKPTHGNGGSPILVQGKLIFTCDGDKKPKVVALDAATGELVWERFRPVSAKKTFSFCTPTAIEVNGQTQVIAPGSDCVLALDPETGDTIWDVRYEGYSVVPKPIYHKGLVYISTSFDNSKMLAIDPTGRGVVTDTKVRWQLDRFIPKTPSMIAYQDHIYSVSDNGILLCVDAESGDTVYRERLGGNFSASPMLIGGQLYFTSEKGTTFVVQAGANEYLLLAENSIPERTLASAAATSEAIFIRTADALYRIE